VRFIYFFVSEAHPNATLRAPWLSRTLSWFFEYCDEDEIDEAEQEVSDAVERINGLYAAAQTGVGQSHKVLDIEIIFALTPV